MSRPPPSSAASLRVAVREARPADHAAFVRLAPELAVDDPPMGEDEFVRERMPTMLVADAGDDARTAGYAYFEIMKDVTYVRHLVTAPETRRSGIGRALMTAIAERARSARCATWCLNVKPGNVAAIALYEGFGMKRTFSTRALKIAWSAVLDAPAPATPGVTARAIEPDDDARVEAAMNLVSGQLASTRALGERVLLALEEAGRVVGATIFHPAFPGAYPFRVARPELAFTLLRAIKPHARPADTLVHVVVEDAPAVADRLVAAGAIVKLESVHMKGPLPEA